MYTRSTRLSKCLLAACLGTATTAVCWARFSRGKDRKPGFCFTDVLAAASTDSSSSHGVLTLKQVQIIVRHGARTPFQTMPGIAECTWDPVALFSDLPEADLAYVVRTPEGGSRPESAMEFSYTRKQLPGGCAVGQLTTVGKRQAFEVGQLLKRMYIDDTNFLDATYDSEELYVRSTNMDRTITTAVSILAGMFGKDNVKEMPTIYTMLNEHESMYPNYYFCKNLQKWTKQAFFDVSALPGYAEALGKVAEALNVDIDETTSPEKFNLLLVHDNLAARLAHGYPCPDRLMQCYDIIKRHASRLMSYFVCGDGSNREEIMKLAAGAFLDILNTRIDDAKQHSHKLHRMHLYSGHDTTIIALLVALDSFDDFWPPYASHVILELYENESNEWFVRSLYNGKELMLDGSDAFCPADKFQALLERYVIKDWDLACGVTKDKLDLGTL